MPRHVILAALGPVLALLLAGCGDDDPASSAKSPAAEETRAANGRNLDACADRTCEVLVEQGDTIRFAAKYEAGTFTVVKISDGRVSFTMSNGEDPPGHGGLSGNTAVGFADVAIELVRVDGGHAILRVRPIQN